MFTPGSKYSIKYNHEGINNIYVSLINEILMSLPSILKALMVVGILQDQLVGPSFQCKINK